MKEPQVDDQKVSLIFYSEEEGKRAMVEKWNIEIGKKYTIGRSKKKVDIIIQKKNISRVHGELIFYDKDKIMVKDLGTINGTFINKEKIDPNKERYFSIHDILSIGDENYEFIFEIPEKKPNLRNDFDEKRENEENCAKKKEYTVNLTINPPIEHFLSNFRGGD